MIRFYYHTKDEFIDWEDILNTICSSLNFTDTFINGFNQQQDAVMKISSKLEQ